MTRRIGVLSVVCLLLAAPRGVAQEKYTIKFKEENQGDTFRMTKTEAGKGATKVADDKGNALKETPENKGHTYSYTATIVERPAGADYPTVITRTYTKAEKVTAGQ